MAKKTADELLEQIYDERFNRIDTSLDDIKMMLGSKASASSVFRLENRMKILEDTHIPCATLLLVQREVADLTKRVDPIVEATDGAVYFTRHPNQLKALIVGAVVLLLISFVPSWLLYRRYSMDKKVQHKTEQTEGKTDQPK